MTATALSPDLTVCSQITVADVARIASDGYRSILCNRPDGESPDQPEAARIRAEAEAHGLRFAFVPVVSGAITEGDVTAFRAAIATLPAPVLAYCRSGTRCQQLWTLAG